MLQKWQTTPFGESPRTNWSFSPRTLQPAMLKQLPFVSIPHWNIVAFPGARGRSSYKQPLKEYIFNYTQARRTWQRAHVVIMNKRERLSPSFITIFFSWGLYELTKSHTHIAI